MCNILELYKKLYIYESAEQVKACLQPCCMQQNITMYMESHVIFKHASNLLQKLHATKFMQLVA
jgi:hypothetical protein